MSSKNLKRIRRVLKFLPILDTIDDIAWEQCFKSEKAFENWIWDACLVLTKILVIQLRNSISIKCLKQFLLKFLSSSFTNKFSFAILGLILISAKDGDE